MQSSQIFLRCRKPILKCDVYPTILVSFPQNLINIRSILVYLVFNPFYLLLKCMICLLIKVNLSLHIEQFSCIILIFFLIARVIFIIPLQLLILFCQTHVLFLQNSISNICILQSFQLLLVKHRNPLNLFDQLGRLIPRFPFIRNPRL